MDYTACREALEDMEADVTAPEVHGTLCAMLCSRRPPRISQWLEEIVPHEGDPGRVTGVLEAAAERACTALAAGECELALLLPDDRHSLSERGHALADWCAGFLYGLGLAGDAMRESLSDEGREVVADLIELSKLDPDDEPDEANERAYTELVEYVRVGVTLIYEEMTGRNDGPGAINALH